MSIALARIFCSSWTGTRGWGSECRPAAFTGSTGDATEARRIVRVGPRGPPRGDGDGAAALPITALSRFPTKEETPWIASDEGLAVSY